MDFARPIHPADAAEYLADQIDARAKNVRRNAELLLGQADALEEAARGVRHDGGLWSRYLPALTTEEGTT